MQLNNVQVERGEGGLVTMQIEVAPEVVRGARERVIKDYSRRIRVPGFRPGHVPANIVRRQVGDESIAQTVSDEIVPQAYQAALQQTELKPLERAQVDQLTFDAFNGDQPLQFTARVIVRPQIELGEVKGLEATQTGVEVTDEDVEKGLDELSNQRATLRDVEGRGAQFGDVVNGELNVFIDGTAHNEEPTRLRSFVLGESGFVPAIDDQLVGAQLDEERRFAVQYPEDFKDADLAGKDAEFAIKLTALKERVKPELNDEFAQSVGLEDMAAVRVRMRQAIQEGREREAQDAVRAELVGKAVEAATFELPTQLVEARTQQRIKNLEHELSHRQSTMEQYLESIAKTREEFEQEVRDEVENETRHELVLDEIASRENLQTNAQEIEMHYHQVAAAMNQPVESIVERLDVDTARASILQRKAIDWLLQNANITVEGGAAADGGATAAGAEPTGAGEAAAEEVSTGTASSETTSSSQ